MDTSATPGPPGELPGARQRRSQGGGQRGLVGQLPQQHRTRVPDQALALAGHRQPVIPPRIVHDEERSCLGNDMVWLPVNFPRTGAFFARWTDPPTVTA